MPMLHCVNAGYAETVMREIRLMAYLNEQRSMRLLLDANPDRSDASPRWRIDRDALVASVASGRHRQVQLSQASRGHRGRSRPRLDTQLHVHALQVLLDRGRAAAQYVADVAIGLASRDPIEHLGFAQRQLERLHHGVD